MHEQNLELVLGVTKQQKAGAGLRSAHGKRNRQNFIPAASLSRTPKKIESNRQPSRIPLLNTMKTNAEQNGSPSHFSQSTYAMLLRANDQRRNVLETALYSCLMACLIVVLMPFSQLVRTAAASPGAEKPIVATATTL